MGSARARRAIVVASTLLIACSTASLSHEGSTVRLVTGQPPPGCTSLGPVTGQGGGSFGGAYVSNDKLIEYAFNDLRNNASELGATHVSHDGPQLGSASGTTSTATVSGVAYRCQFGQEAPTQPPPSAPPSQAPSPPAPPPPQAQAPAQPQQPLSENLQGQVRAALEAQRDAVIACADRPSVPVRAAVDAAGVVTVSLQGDLAGTPEEDCVRQTLGTLQVQSDGTSGYVIHLIR